MVDPLHRADDRRGAVSAAGGDATLYVLGCGGPTDADGVGDVTRFVWRCLVRIAPGRRDAVLAFTSMPRLMAFTRAVNGRTAQAVSTEALKIDARRLGAAPGVEVTIDLEADGFAAWLADGALIERPVPELGA